MEELRFETKNLTQENIKKLGELFPSVITEIEDENGNLRTGINFELLKQKLSHDVASGNEIYDFTWVGKRASMVDAHTSIRKTLRPAIEESENWETTENLFIEGDNLDALKLLQESYLDAIKIIYVDPPYNTGNDSFVYADDYRMDQDELDREMEYRDEEGNINFRKNIDTNPRFHSDWCSMMYSRLRLAQSLLTEDGVIFISIDDNELYNLKKICDEIFGASNFVSTVVVNRASEIASNTTISKHEYMLIYCKNQDRFKVEGTKKYTISRGTVGNIDQTMPVIQFPKGLRCENIPDGIYKETRKIEGSRENIENLGPIEVRDGKLAHDIKLKARWRSSNDMRNFFANQCEPTVAKISGVVEEIYFQGDRFMPYIKKRTYEKLPSLFLENKRGSADLGRLDLGGLFSFPKSTAFLKHYFSTIDLANGQIVLDFFAGSCTTAEAVMQLNAEDGGNRKFIMVQLPEETGEKSEAYREGYKTIAEIGKERIRRAGEKIKAEIEEENKKLKDGMPKKVPDLGFRVLKVDSTNMNDVYYAANEVTQDLISQMESNIKEDRTDLDLLYGVLVDWGLKLSLDHQMETINGVPVHLVDHGSLIACFAPNVGEEIVREIAKRQPLRVVFRDSSFTSSPDKINVEEIFKLLAPHTVVKVI